MFKTFIFTFNTDIGYFDDDHLSEFIESKIQEFTKDGWVEKTRSAPSISISNQGDYVDLAVSITSQFEM